MLGGRKPRSESVSGTQPSAPLRTRSGPPTSPLHSVTGDVDTRVRIRNIRHALNDDSVVALVAIGLSLRTYDCSEDVKRLRRPLGVVQGSEDEFGTPDEIRPLLDQGDPPGRLYLVEGTSHMFPGRAPEAAARVVEAAEQILGGLRAVSS